MNQKEKIKAWKLAARPKNKSTQDRIVALKCLSVCYGDGNGVGKDPEESFKFGSIAAKAMCILLLFVFFIFCISLLASPISFYITTGNAAGRCRSPDCYWLLLPSRNRREAEFQISCALVLQSGSTRFYTCAARACWLLYAWRWRYSRP